MKIHLALDVDETWLRRVRARTDRGGVATRTEFKAWAQTVLSDARAALPTPKTRKQGAPRAGTDQAGSTPVRSTSYHATITALPPTAVCTICGRTKAEGHGGLAFSCLPGSNIPRGARFAL